MSWATTGTKTRWRQLAGKHPAWGHRKIWALVRHAGHHVSPSTVLSIMADEGLLLRADYQKQRRELARQRKAAFAAPLTGGEPGLAIRVRRVRDHQWRVAGVADYFSKVRVRLALVTNREPAQLHRRGRVRAGRGRSHARRRPAGRSPDQSRHRR
ncbi:IS3 family transposase [Arachnia propionica]|uniref:IS3 family transposase n=1 Tax=Arachnia propionica TaxID=1750 RepID=UPI003C703B08